MVSYKRRGLWLLIPGLSGFLLFYVIPFFFSFYYSIIDNTFNKKFVGLQNYITVLNNKYYRLALKNTFEFTGIGVPVLVLASFVLAILMVSATGRLKLCRAAFVIPLLLPSAAVVMIWQVLFSQDGYIIRQIPALATILGESGINKLPIYLFFLWKNTGYNMILFISGLISIPSDIYEAASIDGAGTFKKHVYLTWPLLLPTTFFVVILSMVNSFKIFKEVYLFFGTSYPEESVYIVQHYMNNHFNKLNYQNLATGAIIFALIVYVIVAIGYRFENRVNREVW